MVEKLRAAVDARRSSEFWIIARTDAAAVEGLEAAIERGRAYRKAGADMLFIEAPRSEAEMETITAAFPDVPLLYNYAEGGKSPAVSLQRLTELGYGAVIFPISALLAATSAVRRVLASIRAEGTPIAVLDELPRFGDFLDFIGLAEVRELERRYASKEEIR
jgi:2-methylisocitrate lyase-like PEP mutase family enzyme